MSDTSSGAYVIDEDYAIVSFNDTIKGLYPQLEVGEKCHRCLMGLDEPCPPCPVANHVFGPRTDDELHRLLEQKYYDSVTGGYSRQGFIREVERVFAEGDRSAYAVVVFDIFNFKAINDALGVEGGDEALSNKPRRHHRAVSQQLGEGRLQGLLPAPRARRRRGGLLGGGARALGAPDDGDHRPPRGVRARARTGQSDIDARPPRPAPGARAPRVARATGREPRADIDEPLAAGFLQRPSHERDLQPCRKRDGSEGLHQLRSDEIISRELAGYLHLPARADPRYGREGPAAGRFWQRILVAWHGRQLPVRRREDRQVLRRRDRGQDDGARRNRLDNRDVPPHRHEDGRRGRRDARSSRSTSSTWST